jgi:G3E family GTPase
LHQNGIDAANSGQHLHRDDHVHSFATWRFESSQPFSLERLRELVRKELPASIYRCKGIIFVADQPDSRYALQIVGRRTEILEIGKWGKQSPRSQIVAIGASDGIDSAALTKKFDRCLAEIEKA